MKRRLHRTCRSHRSARPTHHDSAGLCEGTIFRSHRTAHTACSANGIIVRHGYIVQEWADTRAVDMTHSVTKTFLSFVAGVAFDQHMIRGIDDRVIDYALATEKPRLLQTSIEAG